MQFETTVKNSIARNGQIQVPELKPLVGKRVKVTVEEIVPVPPKVVA